jgi:hypothetical protein
MVSAKQQVINKRHSNQKGLEWKYQVCICDDIYRYCSLVFASCPVAMQLWNWISNSISFNLIAQPLKKYG